MVDQGAELVGVVEGERGIQSKEGQQTVSVVFAGIALRAEHQDASGGASWPVGVGYLDAQQGRAAAAVAVARRAAVDLDR